jgi:predicted  nucleic acid-binding Zn-ribbon protein
MTVLLDIQDHDTRIDQLRHRRASLPERAALTEHESALVGIETERRKLEERLAELRRSQKRLEDDVATIEAKVAAENLRMYSGTVTSPRELQAMQEEIDALGRRRGDLEDEVLQLMELAEPVEAELAALAARTDSHVTAAEELRAAIAAAEAVLDGQLDEVLQERAPLAADLPEGLLATYEKLRGRLGGVAVARLEGGQCLGCHLSLPATEVEAVRRAGPDEVVIHEECGRILVR